MKKREAQNIHAIKRARQRYKVELTLDDLKQIANKIRKGKSTFVESSTLRVTKHLVTHKGIVMVVAYDKYRNAVCSLLPKSSLTKRAPDLGQAQPNPGNDDVAPSG